jgi:TPR repeat protein
MARRLMAGLAAALALAACGARADAAQDAIRAEMVEALNAYAVYKMGRYEEAYAAWLALAEKGNAQGILNVAAMLEAGKGVARDPQAAAAWWRRGAELDDALSIHSLSRAYREGVGVPVDPAEADILLERAAGAGAVAAQRELGQARLAAGDAEGARLWLRRASDAGDAAAQAALARLDGAAPAPQAGALPEAARRRVAAFLRDLDDAANARDEGWLTGAIAADAPIDVLLPGQTQALRMSRADYAELWRATFAQAGRYRFTRAWFDVASAPGGAMVDSRIRETFADGEGARVLLLAERLELALAGDEPVIRSVRLEVTAPDGAAIR